MEKLWVHPLCLRLEDRWLNIRDSSISNAAPSLIHKKALFVTKDAFNLST